MRHLALKVQVYLVPYQRQDYIGRGLSLQLFDPILCSFKGILHIKIKGITWLVMS